MTIQEEASLAISPEEQREIEHMYAGLRKRKAKLVGPDGHAQSLPHSLYAFLSQLIADLKEGKSVAIINNHALLTTSEAAKLLGTSRQYLVNRLEAGDIPFHKVGSHRRIEMVHLLEYKAQRDVQRRKAINDLARAEATDGLYDSVPPNQ